MVIEADKAKDSQDFNNCGAAALATSVQKDTWCKVRARSAVTVTSMAFTEVELIQNFRVSRTTFIFVLLKVQVPWFRLRSHWHKSYTCHLLSFCSFNDRHSVARSGKPHCCHLLTGKLFLFVLKNTHASVCCALLQRWSNSLISVRPEDYSS